MNDRSIIQSPENSERELWVDQYLPNDSGAAERKSSIDAAWVRGLLFRQRWLIASCLFVALTGGIVLTLLISPVYEATATVRVFPRVASIVEGQDVAAPAIGGNELAGFFATQTEIISSQMLAEVVARNLDFGNRNGPLGTNIDKQRPPGRTDEQWREDKIKLAANVLQSNVVANLPSQAQIIAISFRTQDPVIAAEVANAYVKGYQQIDLQRSLGSNSYARDFLLEQIAEVRERLDQAEKAANQYSRASGIVTQPGSSEDEGSSTLTGTNLASINQTYTEARAKRIAAEQKWRAISNIPASQVPEVINSAVVQSLLGERGKLNAELAVLRQRYNDDFPAIVDVRSRLALVDQQFDKIGADIRGTIRSEYLIAKQQEEALETELGSISADALVEKDKQVELTGLEREATAVREQLKTLLDRYNQINTAANVESGTITPLDPAVVPSSPVEPSLARNMVIALLLGTLVAGGLALVREIFVDQFRRAEDIEDRLGIPFLGLTPNVKEADIETAESSQFNSLMEAYASIRSAVDFAVPRDGVVLQLTSSQASEGKSTTALILAQLFARLGRNTLLVDSDLRKPTVQYLLNIEAKVGLTEVLLGHISFDAAKIEGIHENLTILPTVGIPPNPAELVSSSLFRDFIKQRRQEYSLVIVDSSPLLGLADAVEISKCVDATVFVIEANRTSLAQARTSLKRLRLVGGNILGAVLTKYRALDAGSDYNYEYQNYGYGKD